MIIKSDAFEMESKRQYASRRTARLAVSDGIVGSDASSKETDAASGSGNNGNAFFMGGLGFGSSRGSFLSTLAYTRDGFLRDDGASSVGSQIPAVRQGRLSTLQRIGALSSELGNVEDMGLQLKFSALNYLFQVFFGGGSFNNLNNSLWGSATAGNYQTLQFNETFEESEMVSFETTGKVLTEDGRELDFNVNVGMSRSFYQETNICQIQEKPRLIDPLIINLDGNPDAISDQTFYFDLDADGEEDEIFSLKQGHGFLALDKNGDGIINDGSELFGALSGNGFEELAAYDLDGNGWIDEADEIFDKLRVWSLDADGNPQLFTLAESDIGAICLASVPTQFSVTDEQNQAKAMVRQSGFFLHESTGSAGTVQQIDLAKVSSN